MQHFQFLGLTSLAQNYKQLLSIVPTLQGGMSKRQPETEKTRAAAAAYMSEGLFEGEEGEGAGDPSVAYGDNTTRSSPKTSSIDKLYIVLIRSRISRLSLRMRSKKKQNFKQDITKNARPPSSAAEFQPGSAHSKAIKFLSPNSELSQDVSVLKFGC